MMLQSFRVPNLYVFFLLLFSAQTLCAQETADGVNLKSEGAREAIKELSFSEWKKFKNFQQILNNSSISAKEKSYSLRTYTRDSLQILEVKLMAIKLLHEKKLLDRDLAENTGYYVTLLHEFRDSEIQPSEYRFLEEKLAFLKQDELEEKLAYSQWAIGGLGLLCVSLMILVIILKKRRHEQLPPELSRQEHTVRNLIIQGKTNKEIASELFISLSTVKSHITNIYNKLQVSGRQELLQKHTGTST